jgi:hypothetical protein
MSSLIILAIFLLLAYAHAVPERFECDIMDPECRERINQQEFMPSGEQKRRSGQCRYEDLWLIPGRADASCSEFIIKTSI